jgi:hypothetical protein
MRRLIWAKNQPLGQRCAITLVALAAFFALFQPLVPQCSMDNGMMASGDCAMAESESDADTNSSGCGDCPTAICFYPSCGASIYGTAFSLYDEFKSAPLVMASETVLTGRTVTPQGPPPKI